MFARARDSWIGRGAVAVAVLIVVVVACTLVVAPKPIARLMPTASPSPTPTLSPSPTARAQVVTAPPLPATSDPSSIPARDAAPLSPTDLTPFRQPSLEPAIGPPPPPNRIE